MCKLYTNVDDILRFSQDFNQHLWHVKKVLEAIKSEGFRLKLAKCHCAQFTGSYLGHVLAYNSVRPHNDNLKSIKNLPQPHSKKNVHQVLGKSNFYHKYIPDYTRVLEPIHNLLRNNIEFKWTDECEKIFTRIKQYLCKSPILSIFDPQRQTFIFTDASALGVGAVLKQVQDTGEVTSIMTPIKLATI